MKYWWILYQRLKQQMENEILFSEKQRFKQWWLWLFLLSINVFTLYGIFFQVIEGIQFGSNPMSNTGLIFTSAVILLLTIFFGLCRLETQIKKDGIFVRFFPFHLTFRHYGWSTISKSFVRQYRPIAEYGGWGLRGLGKDKALNVSGNKGLQLEFMNNKKLLIGTKKPRDITEILIRIGQNKPYQSF